jgi:uncharacterized protein (UPF0276 family)
MIRVGCVFRAGLIPWMWEYGELIDTYEHALDAFVSAGDDGVRAAATCAEMGDYSLHCIDLSLGSPAARTRPKQFDEIKQIIEVMGASTISDHLAYNRVDDRRLHDFAPLWRVEEQLDLFADNVAWAQERLGVRLLVENVASLFDPGGEMGEAEFANEVHRRTGCGLLLDISNMLINEVNGFCDAAAEFDALDLEAVEQVHLAGGELVEGLMWDAHSSPLPANDVEWLERLLPRMPNCTSVIIERDERLQQGDELVEDLRAVRAAVARAQAAVALPA